MKINHSQEAESKSFDKILKQQKRYFQKYFIDAQLHTRTFAALPPEVTPKYFIPGHKK